MNLGELGGALGDTLGKGAEGLGAMFGGKEPDESAHERTSEQHAEQGAKFCSQCGAKLTTTAKFCPECGRPTSSQQTPVPQATRQTVFDGSVHKCPHCGDAINPTDAVCPTCGRHIADRATSNSILLFSQQMMDIEKSRRNDGLLGAIIGGLGGGQADNIDKQKIILINTFPVPNTVEELSEFMYLAASSIDVKLSKKGLFRGTPSVEKDLSDAWVAKMQQIYQKAAMSFPNDSAFGQIKKLYVEKMTELKMKVD